MMSAGLPRSSDPGASAAEGDTPLAGLTVLEMTQAYAGPYASLILRFLGARVIKIEQPGTGDMTRTNPPYFDGVDVSLVPRSTDDFSLPFLNRSRGKESLVLDLKSPEGKTSLTHLVTKADILIENFSSGAMARLGLGPAWARDINPCLIYCSITGLGREATGASARAMDPMIQALCGLMDVTGAADGPPTRVGIPIGDLIAPLYAVIGILAAVNRRHATGVGDDIDVSMLDCLTSFVAGEHFDAMKACGIPTRTGNTLPRMTPFGAFPSADGHVAICAPMDNSAFALFRAMGRPELIQDVRFATRESRVANQGTLDDLISAWASSIASDDLLRILAAEDVPSAPVRDVLSALHDERVWTRGAVVELHSMSGDHVSGQPPIGSGIPILFSEAEVGLPEHAPTLGEHTQTILAELDER
jgi:crotonobetainyl-CoA:carnitine CoA-transferase CaiB-like acyl-CoA transferase